MPWFKVDDHIYSHPASLKAGDAALGLWLRMGCWLAMFPQQDGFIPKSMLRRTSKPSQIRALVASGLWDEVEGGYRQHRGMDICTSGLPGRFWEVDDTRPRKSIPDLLRAAVYDRDGRACVECGATSDLSLDHIYPHSLGGEDTLDNFRTLCRPCNSRKGARV